MNIYCTMQSMLKELPAFKKVLEFLMCETLVHSFSLFQLCPGAVKTSLEEDRGNELASSKLFPLIAEFRSDREPVCVLPSYLSQGLLGRFCQIKYTAGRNRKRWEGGLGGGV